MSTFPVGAKVTGDTAGFVTAVSAGARSLQGFAGAAGLAARATGALAGAAAMGAAIAAAREYQTELVKLNTLVGIQTEQIEAWDEALKDLAVETGRAPADLARAMFAITSGGARGTEAMELLTQAAKGSALGLGNMTSLGRTATAMLQAFADEGLSGQKAMDVLLLTMRQGNLEAGGLAGAFARVLGPAKELGSSVEEIGAFLATFTRLGGSTEEAATGLLNIFQLLIKPPEEARKAMLKYGISVEEVRETLDRDGLPAALGVMKDAIGDSVDATGEMIPSVRALIAFLSTAGLQAESFAADLEIMRNGLGAVNESFLVWGGSADAVFTRFSAQIKVSGVAIGELLLPPLGVLLSLLTPLIGLLRTSADGFEEIAEIAGLTSDNWRILSFEVKNLLGLLEEETATVTELQAALREVSDEALLDQQKDLSRQAKELAKDIEALNLVIEAEAALPAHLTDIPGLVKMRDTVADITVKHEGLTASLAAVNAEMISRNAVEKEVNDEIERGIQLTEEEQEALEKRQKQIVAIKTQLEEEVLRLAEGEAAVLDKRLADLMATKETREHVAALLEEIAALEDDTKAEKEAAREKERTARATKRQFETVRQARVRERATAVRALERAELARLNAEMQEAKEISQDFAEAIGSAFEDVVDGTKNVGDAFADMVTEILKQIQRLVIQRAIVEPILGAIFGALAPGGASVGGGGRAPGFDFQGLSTIAVGSTAPLVSQPGSLGGAQGPPQTIVQQTINIAPQLINARDGQRFVEEQAPVIARIVSDAARQSGEFAQSLR